MTWGLPMSSFLCCAIVRQWLTSSGKNPHFPLTLWGKNGEVNAGMWASRTLIAFIVIYFTAATTAIAGNDGKGTGTAISIKSEKSSMNLL